MSVGAKF